MPQPQLTVRRHDSTDRTLLTLSGEIDLDMASLINESVQGCLNDGVLTVDIDLSEVTFCDCSGLNSFLLASLDVTKAGGVLTLRRPQPLTYRVIELTGCEFLLGGPPFARPAAHVPAPRDPAWHASVGS